MTDLAPAEHVRLQTATIEFRAAMAPLSGLPWRVGRTLGTTVYAVTAANWKQQANIGRIDTPELAARAIGDHNLVLDLLWLLRARLDVRIIPDVESGTPVELVLTDEEGVHVATVAAEPGHGVAELLATGRAAAEREGRA